MSALTLRSARSTDAGRTGAILSQFVDDTPWMPRLHTRAEDVAFAAAMIDRGWMQVAQTGGEVGGFLAQDGAEVISLYVDAAYRRKGLGTALLDHAKARSARLTLWTFAANGTAQSFYLRHGFAEVARSEGASNDERLPDIHYAWRKEA